MVVTNVLPTFKVEKAILNRIVVIPFNNTFKTNISFEAEMMEKLDIIFSFIMKYGVIRDEFDLNEEMALAKKNYVENNNEPLDEFIKEMVNITDNENDKIPNTDFFVSYQNWLQQNNIKISTTKQKVTRDIKKYNIESKESNGKTWYKKCAWKVSDTELDVL
jgi:phage/plasmid-associated DNA primase